MRPQPYSNIPLCEAGAVTTDGGRVMAQAVSSRPVTAESQLRARVNPCRICGGQSGTRTGFSSRSSVFPCQYHSTVIFHTHVSSGRRTMYPFAAAVQRRSPLHKKHRRHYSASVYSVLTYKREFTCKHSFCHPC
jgi:hypothetical protein